MPAPEHSSPPNPKGTWQFLIALAIVLVGVVFGTLLTMRFENRRWHGHGPPLGHEVPANRATTPPATNSATTQAVQQSTP